MRGAACFLITALLSSPAIAGDAFCADRPGLGTGACRMPPGVLQLETSLADWSVTHASGTSHGLALGSSQVRLGVGRKLELSLAFDPYLSERGGRRRVAGHGDVTLGAKIALVDADSVALALAPVMKLPTANKAFGNGKVEAALALLSDVDLGAGLGLSLAAEGDMLADADGAGHHAGAGASASLGRDLSESLSAGIDIASSWEFDPSGTGRSTAAGLSLAWQAAPRLQLDVEADRRLGGDAPAWELVTGFAYRF